MQYEVSGMTLIPQQLDWSCWYASAQMLIQWKQDSLQQSLADLVPPDLDAMCRKIRDDNQGITNPQIMDMAQRLGLATVPPVCPTPSTISGWLQDYGPLWVNGKTHIVVIAGINGLNVKVYDPSPKNAGNIDWRSLQTWYKGSDVELTRHKRRCPGGLPVLSVVSRDSDEVRSGVLVEISRDDRARCPAPSRCESTSRPIAGPRRRQRSPGLCPGGSVPMPQ